MKKYVASLIPFVFCTILSFIYGMKTPSEKLETYPYQTEWMLDYLSIGWLLVGFIMSGMFITMFLIGDVFDYVVKIINKIREEK